MYFEPDETVTTETQDDLINGQKTAEVSRKSEYVCNGCSKQLSSMYSLKRHREIHSKEKPFECWLCINCMF